VSCKPPGKTRPPGRLLTTCAKEERAPPPHWGMGNRSERASELLSNAQEVKLVVWGAELGRRLKKRKRERSVSPESKIPFENSRECGARALTSQVGLLSLSCAPCPSGGDREDWQRTDTAGASKGRRRVPTCCSAGVVKARAARFRRDLGSGAGNLEQGTRAKGLVSRGVGSTRKETSRVAGAAGLPRLPPERLQLPPSRLRNGERPSGRRARRVRPAPCTPAAARGRLPTRSALLTALPPPSSQ
jgi:hypothetical protein